MGWKAGLALIIGLGVLLTYMGVLPINNLFPEPRYGVPYSNLGIRNITTETYAKLRQETPKITEGLIVSSVGEDYFKAHFRLGNVFVYNSTDGDWFAQAQYLYEVSVGNYTGICDASAWFNERGEVIYVEGIPRRDNLMPFSVTREQAIELAKYRGKPGQFNGVDAEIRYIGTYTILPRVDKYAWDINFWRITGGDPMLGGVTGIMTDVIIDANTGYVYRVRSTNYSAMN